MKTRTHDLSRLSTQFRSNMGAPERGVVRKAMELLAELQRAKRASGAPLPPAHPRLQTLGEGEESPNAIRPGRRRMSVRTEGDGEKKSQCR